MRRCYTSQQQASAWGMSFSKMQGFTLLEVVVALSILVICMTVVMRILGGSTRLAAIGGDYYTALQIAESKMAELTVLSGSGVFIDTGTSSEGFDWVAEANPYKAGFDSPIFPTSIANEPLAAYQLYQLDVSVFWGGVKKREFQLFSLHLRPAEGAGE